MTKRSSWRTRQARQHILEFIRQYKAEHYGLSPSVRDIMAACNIATTSTVFYHLKSLQDQGVISITPVSRGIDLPGEQYTLPDPVQVR